MGEYFMSINNKLQKIVSLFSGIILNKKDNYSSLPKKSITTSLKNTSIDFVEKYKGVRRTILLIVLWINIHIFFVTIEMYRKVNSVDTQWVIYAGYWTAILGTFIGFYTVSRVKEFNSNTSYSKQGEWLSSNNEPKSGATEFTKNECISFYEDKNN